MTIDTLTPAVQGDVTATRTQVAAVVRRAALIHGLSDDDTTRMVFKFMPMAGRELIGTVQRAVRAEIYGGRK